MFLDIDMHDKDSIAAIDDTGHEITYSELCVSAKENLELPKRVVVFILCENTIGALNTYIMCIENNIIPLMLSSNLNEEFLEGLIKHYEPYAIFLPSNKSSITKYKKIIFNKYDYTCVRTDYQQYNVNEQLELLMTTSGSTGSPKLVRYKKGNLYVNAKNVAKAFRWKKSERPLCDLEMNYTMGLNVINSHLVIGATLLLTTHNIMSSDYWDFLKIRQATNFTGVPFSYELLMRLGFENMDIPYLRTLAEGGGKLSDDMFRRLSSYAQKTGKKFIATFGTTETSARMSLLPPEKALEKCGSIGKAIPEGELFLIDEDGKKINGENIEGELGFRGPNVTMGYAENIEDLQKGDVFKGVFHTGDIAYKDKDGFYYIKGRKARFLKLLGHRVELDEIERLVKDEYTVDCACIGTDEKLIIFITDAIFSEKIINYISKMTGIYRNMFEVKDVKLIPRNGNGKILYKELESVE